MNQQNKEIIIIMKECKFYFLLIFIMIIMIVCLGCKNEKKQENKFFPEELDEVGCASSFDANLEYNVVDKTLITEFTNMLNECIFRESSDEIPNFETSEDRQQKMGIVKITMGDLIFYLESNGRYRNINEEKYYFLENFDQELFEKFFMARQEDNTKQ